jgi:hypothetical protein
MSVALVIQNAKGLRRIVYSSLACLALPYLGSIIYYEKELDIDNKLHKYLKITGI